MKVLLLTTHLDIGGISTYTIWLAEGLVKRGHGVWVASSGGELVSELQARGIPHLKVNIRTKNELSPRVFWTALQLKRVIVKESIDLIHAQTRVGQVAAHLLSRLTRMPYVTTSHGLFENRFFRRVFPCWGARVIAISEPVRAHLVNEFRVPKKNVRLIHNGINAERFSRRFTEEEKIGARRRYDLREGSPVVGIVARLVAVKGHEHFLLAAKEILKKRPDVQFLIVGEGKSKGRLIELAKRLEITDSVSFTGGIRDVIPPLSVMDVFAFPAFWQEPFGLSVLEAMACGKPVVASNVGGIYAMVKDGENGFLVPPRESEALADAILRLLDDKELASRMGRAGRKIASERFSLDEIVRKIEGVYQEVAGGL